MKKTTLATIKSFIKREVKSGNLWLWLIIIISIISFLFGW